MPGWPKEWTEAADTGSFFGEVEAGASLLMLDYDGTVAPFTANRLEALPYEGVRERLKALLQLPGVRLVLVTGRPARELKELIALDNPVEIWGSHGREHLLEEGSYTLEEITPRQMQVLDEIAKQISGAGFGDETLERKPASLAVHWRALDATGQQELRSLTITSFERSGPEADLRLLKFESGLEIRCDNVHKGDAIRGTLATVERQTPAAYLGDDLTDEDGFRAMRGRGLTILVAQQARESAAEYWLRPPEQLLSFLDAWIAHAAAQREERRS